MNKAECIAKMGDICARFNEELQSEAPNLNTLNAIEEEAKEVQGTMKSLRKAEVFAELDKFANPMLEAARMAEFEYEGIIVEKEKGVVLGMHTGIRTAPIKATEYTKHLMKLAASKATGAHFEKTGVIVNGHKWEYMCEKLGLLLAYRALKELGGDADALKELLKSYVIRDAAKEEKAGATPTSNTKLKELVQPIVNALVWVDNGKGGNKLIVNSRDVAFLVSCFSKHGKGLGTVQVLAGKKVTDYVFEMVHMIVTGKPYELQYKKKKEDEAEKPVRKPVKAEEVPVIEVPVPDAEAPVAEATEA